MSINGSERREAERQARMAFEFLASEAMRSGTGDVGKSADERKVEVLTLAGMFAEASKTMGHLSPASSSDNIWALNARVLWHAFSSDSILAPRFGVKLPFGNGVIGSELENIARELVNDNGGRYGFDFMSDRDDFIRAWTSTGGSSSVAGGSVGWAPQPRAAISADVLDEVGAALTKSLAGMESASADSDGGWGSPWWRREAASAVAAKVAEALKGPSIGAKIAARAAGQSGEEGPAARTPSA